MDTWSDGEGLGLVGADRADPHPVDVNLVGAGTTREAADPLDGERGVRLDHENPLPPHDEHRPLPLQAPHDPGPLPLSPVPPQTPWHFPDPPQFEQFAMIAPSA